MAGFSQVSSGAFYAPPFKLTSTIPTDKSAVSLGSQLTGYTAADSDSKIGYTNNAYRHSHTVIEVHVQDGNQIGYREQHSLTFIQSKYSCDDFINQKTGSPTY